MAFSLDSFTDPTRGPLSAVALCLMGLSLIPLLLFLDRIELLNYLYPACAFAIGFWFYATTPAYYVGFTFWVWFITPFVRRVLDYEAGAFDPISLVMLAPILVTLIAGISLLRYGGNLWSRTYAPFVFILVGLLHGFLIGAVRVGPQSATFALLEWLVPLLFGLHLALIWRKYPSLLSTLRSTFAWGLLAMGTYGLYQFFVAPPWDMMWMMESKMFVSMGLPEPMQFRVFSTLNSTGPLAFVVCGILLLLMNGRGAVTKLAVLPGYAVLLFSLVRAAWVGWIAGVAYLAWRLQGRLRTRLTAVLVVTVFLGVPFFLFSPLSEEIASRAQTFAELEEDDSFNARMGLYARGLRAIGTNPLGDGLGSFGVAAKLSSGSVHSFDSGVFDLLFSLGWLGSLFFITGLVLLLRRTAFAPTYSDPQEPFLQSITVSFLVMLLFINQFAGVMGMMFWTATSLALAARLHAERTPEPDDDAPPSPVREPSASRSYATLSA